MFLFNKKKKLSERLKIEVNLFKFSLNFYFTEKDIDPSVYVIHMIECTDIKQEYSKFKITLSRPGSFIGKGGKSINDLTSFMKLEFKKDVFLELVEYNPLRPDYTKMY